MASKHVGMIAISTGTGLVMLPFLIQLSYSSLVKSGVAFVID
jgi:hypothetical protein